MAILSICIPTYNRADCLPALLDSIIEQSSADLEVVVSDNASIDNTAELIAHYKSRLPNLKYVRQSKNIGADRNFLAVVGEASGDYAWLMGDDDKLEPGAINNVLKAISQWPNVPGLITGVVYYDKTMRIITGKRTLPPTTRYEGADAIFSTIFEHLGYMSAIIVNRGMWNTVCREDQVLNFRNQYIHVYIIGRMMQRFGGWGLLQNVCVGYRTGSDRLLAENGLLQRMKIDVAGYEQITKALFGKSAATYGRAKSRLFRKLILGWLVQYRVSVDSYSTLFPVMKYLYRYYGAVPAFWYAAVPMAAAPKTLLNFLRSIRKQT